MSEHKKRPRILRRDDSFTATIDTGASNNSFALRSIPEAAAGQGRAGSDSNKDTVSESAALKPTSRRRQEPEKRPAPDTKAELIKLNFTIPAELARRAESMAVAAKCPARRVATTALGQIKPELFEAFTSVKYADIDTTRQTDVGMRISTSWVVSTEMLAQLTKELDPLGIGQVNSLLSAWVRDRFIRHFNGYLSAAGY